MKRRTHRLGLSTLALALGCAGSTPPEVTLVACGSAAKGQPEAKQLSVATCTEAGSATHRPLVRVQAPERAGRVLRIRVNDGKAHWADSADAPSQLLCTRLDTALDRQLLIAVDPSASEAVVAAVVVEGGWASDRNIIDEATCNELQPAEASRSLIVSSSPSAVNQTVTPTASPTVTPTASPTVTPTASPTVTPTASPTATATASPTAMANPTATSTARPTPVPAGKK